MILEMHDGKCRLESTVLNLMILDGKNMKGLVTDCVWKIKKKSLLKKIELSVFTNHTAILKLDMASVYRGYRSKEK